MVKPYTSRQLLRYQIRDLLVDIRCAYRDGLEVYAMGLERDVIRLGSNDCTMGQYGWFS